MMTANRKSTIRRSDILYLEDSGFNLDNVCIVTAAGSGIGRATAVAAAVNGLMTVGLDVNEKKGTRTQQIARDMGGQMIFIRTDMCRDEQLCHAVAEAAKIGSIRYLANITPMPRIGDLTQFSIKRCDHLYRLIVRAPIFLTKLVVKQMKTQTEAAGVIGNLNWHSTRLFTVRCRTQGTDILGASMLDPSVLVRGERCIRAFSLNSEIGLDGADNPWAVAHSKMDVPEGDEENDTVRRHEPASQKISSIDMANLFIFGFSRFARFFTDGRLRMENISRSE